MWSSWLSNLVCLLSCHLVVALINSQNDTFNSTFRLSASQIAAANLSESTVHNVEVAHGTYGQTQACAPSGLRAFWDDWHEPFPIALQGYAVVAPDYAGLGVPNGVGQYFMLPAQANDLYHAITAAQCACLSLLSKEFVMAGQSQGGGVAWAAAQRQFNRPLEGYLGTMTASPFTDVLAAIVANETAEDNARVAGNAQGLDTVLPDFQLSDWLTQVGVAR